MRMLALSYGVWAVYQEYKDSRKGYFYEALHELLNNNKITEDDLVAYLSGSFGDGGTTFLEINRVDKVLKAADKYFLPTFKDETNNK
jgi:pyruvate kinase